MIKIGIIEKPLCANVNETLPPPGI